MARQDRVDVVGGGRRVRAAAAVGGAVALGVWLVSRLGLLRPLEAPVRRLLSEGIAVDGLLRRSWESGVEGLWSLPLLLAVAALTLPLAWRRNLRTGSLLTLALMAVTVVVGAALLATGPVEIPVVEMLAVELLVLASVVWRRTVRWGSTLVSLLSDTNQSLRELTGPASFTTAPQHWSLVVTALDQTLTLDRVIILEAVPGQHKVRELSALRCSIDDVVERRRDMRRPPYSTALFRRAPLRVDGGDRSFLSRCAEGEQQYLVPLVFGHEVFGFLAVGIGSEDESEDERFVSQLQGFAEQIAELLYLRSRGAPAGAAPQPLAIDPESEVQRAVLSTVQLMGRRITRLERLLARASSPTIVYDLFGRVLEVNPAMLEVLEREEMSANELTALDMTEAFTRKERDHLRELLRHVVLEGGETSLPAHLGSAPERSLVLRLRPLAAGGQGAARRGARFDVAGVVCELRDVTATVRLGDMERQVGASARELRASLSEASAEVDRLHDQGLSPADRSHAIDALAEHCRRSLERLEECELELAGAARPEPVLCLPVDGSSAVEEAVEARRQAFAERGLEVGLERPRMSPLVFASPTELPLLFGEVLDAVASTAGSGTLSVGVAEEVGERLEYRFLGPVASLEPSRLEAQLAGAEAPVAAWVETLVRARRWARGWGGDLEVSVAGGGRVAVTVALRCLV